MAIDFGPRRWEKLKQTYKAWWAGELDRPIIPAIVADRNPGRARPAVPLLTQATCADLSVPADKIIDRIDYELSRYSYLGDAFPFFGMECFGPGVGAVFMGARLDNSTGRVWFHPPADVDIRDIRLGFDPDNVYFRRIRDICAAGMKRWQGQVLMGMTDIGGSLDLLSTFRPGQKLLLDLYDHPDEVRRLTWEAHDAWHRYYSALNETLQPVNPGYSDWSAIYSDLPNYMLQCDFCYMIGPAMFDEFVRGELEVACRRLPRPFYHLDGKGQLPHLDSLLAIPELKGVQWVPGDGNPDCGHWPEVYGKVRKAGKLIQLMGSGRFETLAAVVRQLGSGRGIQVWQFTADNAGLTRRGLEKFGVE